MQIVENLVEWQATYRAGWLAHLQKRHANLTGACISAPINGIPAALTTWHAGRVRPTAPPRGTDSAGQAQ